MASKPTCFARRYKAGSPIANTQFMSNVKKCKNHSVNRDKCVNLKNDDDFICLWGTEQDRFELEGPGVKSTTFIPTQIASKNEAMKMFKNRGRISKESIINRKHEKSKKKDEKETIIITTIDSNHNAYEVEYGSMDAQTEFISGLNTLSKQSVHQKHSEKLPQKDTTTISNPKQNEVSSPLNKDGKQHQTRDDTYKLPPLIHHHRVHQKTVAVNRRRLKVEPVTTINMRNAEYASVGLIRILFDIQEVAIATGTILHATNGNGNGNNYVYVLAAAHDIVQKERDNDEQMIIYQAFRYYNFYPAQQIYNVEFEKRNKQHDLKNLDRVWIIKKFKGLHKEGNDVAIFRFPFENGKVYKLPSMAIKPDVPIKKINANEVDFDKKPANPTKATMVMYNRAKEVDGNNNPMAYIIVQQKVGIYEVHHKNYMNEVYFNHGAGKGGYCGGPIIQQKHITAMFYAANCNDGAELDCWGLMAKMIGSRTKYINSIYNANEALTQIGEWQRFDQYIKSFKPTTKLPNRLMQDLMAQHGIQQKKPIEQKKDEPVSDVKIKNNNDIQQYPDKRRGSITLGVSEQQQYKEALKRTYKKNNEREKKKDHDKKAMKEMENILSEYGYYDNDNLFDQQLLYMPGGDDVLHPQYESSYGYIMEEVLVGVDILLFGIVWFSLFCIIGFMVSIIGCRVLKTFGYKRLDDGDDEEEANISEEDLSMEIEDESA